MIFVLIRDNCYLTTMADKLNVSKLFYCSIFYEYQSFISLSNSCSKEQMSLKRQLLAEQCNMPNNCRTVDTKKLHI